MQKWAERNSSDLKVNHLNSKTIYHNKIDIILPIYNGFEYFDSLFSSLRKTQIDYNLIVINDCSTDDRIYPYLLQLSKNDERVIIINNTENLGFVASVNRGLEKAENHVALVNSDIELPELWLERLMRPIIIDNSVASINPIYKQWHDL
jgi:GT2 family glycosyltransferase